MSVENTLKVLSEQNINKIIDKAYRVNENIGISVKNKELQNLLVSSGAKKDGDIVRIPRKIIKKCLKMVPKSFYFYDRNGKRYEAKKGCSFLGTMSDGINILDSKTLKARSATKSDLINLTKIADYIEEITFSALQVTPSEGEGLFAQLDAMRIILENTSKPIIVSPISSFIAETWIEIEALSRESIKNHNSSSIVMVICPDSPLMFNNSNSRKILMAARNNIPIIIASGPIGGMTGPFTLAGNLVQSLAETFFGITVSQLINEGTPIVLNTAATIMELKTGGITNAAPETMLIMSAFAEISNYFGFPSHAGVASPDPDKIDSQTGAEMMMGFMSLLSSRPTIMSGIGALSKGIITSPQKMIIDVEFYKMAKRIYQGIEVNEKYLAYENIKNIRKNKNYLMDELTLSESRKGEYYVPDLLNREVRRKGSKDIIDRAKEKVDHIIENHKPKIDEKFLSKLEDFFEEKTMKTRKVIL